MVDFENHRVLETIQTPGAAIEARAEDDELLGRRGGGDGAIQDHCSELIENAHPALPERIRRCSGAAGKPGTRAVHLLLQSVREQLEGEWVGKAGHLGRERTERAIQRHELGGPARFSFSHSK